MDAVRSALAVHRGRVTELLRAWDKDVDTVDFRTFSRTEVKQRESARKRAEVDRALLDLKVDPQQRESGQCPSQLRRRGLPPAPRSAITGPNQGIP